jgi:hypothetical protein
MTAKHPKPIKEFGARKPSVPTTPSPPAKRSGHVGLLLMGTLAVGGGAYALMPRDNCERTPPGMAQPGAPQAVTDCQPRGSTSGGHGGSGGATSSRSSFFSGDSSSSHSAAGTSDAGSGGATRGGFGSFGHAFGFSGG